MPTIKLLKRAEFELLDACSWYEKQQKGLSLRFREEIKISLNIIKANPLLYTKRYSTELRFCVVRKFPFIIVFWFDENINAIFIASIFNTNRNPEELTLHY